MENAKGNTGLRDSAGIFADGEELPVERLLKLDAVRLGTAKRTGEVRRVGVICWSKTGGGAEQATRLWARNFCRELDVFWLCDDRQPFGDESRFDVAGVSDRSIPYGSVLLTDAEAARARAEGLQAVIAAEGIDTVLLVDHSVWRAYADAYAAMECGCRAVMADHNAYFYPLDNADPLLYRLREVFYPAFDAVTALSPANVAWWRSAGLRNVVYMPNFLTFDPEGVRAPADGKAAGFVCIGRICKRKGMDLAIRAYAEYLKAHVGEPEALTFCGRFESKEVEREMRGVAEECGIAGRVTFAGQVDNVQDYLSGAKALVMASRIEGAPMVLMEAKSYGVPAIMFELPFVDVTGPSDGVLNVPYGDVAGLARMMEKVSSDEETRRRLGEDAKRSLEGYVQAKIRDRWQKLLRQIGDGKREIDADCELPSAERMFAMTMRSCSSFVSVLAEEQLRRLKEPSEGFPYPIWIKGGNALQSVLLSLAPYGLMRKRLAREGIDIEWTKPDRRLAIRLRRAAKASLPYTLVMSMRKLLDRA